MAGDRVQRRLAAIMLVDMVGFSRTMAADETGTMARLRSVRLEVIEPAIHEHGGRIVKTTGDGALAEFASAVDAVECAATIQREIAVRNTNCGSKRTEFRIGINLGEVIVEEDDVYGHGVNVAARLEALSRPGGVCISNDLHRQVVGKTEVRFAAGGAKDIKNIPELVRIWRWSPDGVANNEAVEDETRPLTIGNKPTIAVLPFDNFGSTREEEFFADGIVEDITSRLSASPDLFVIARHSSFRFKGKALDLQDVSSALGVQYIVEGSIRRSARRVRVSAQLIDAAHDRHLWSEHYDRELTDVFAVQDDIVEAVTGSLFGRIARADFERARLSPPTKINAYEATHQAWALCMEPTAAGLSTARQLAEKAVAIEPNYSRAHTVRALTILREVQQIWTADPRASLVLAEEALRRAVSLNARDYLAHWVLGTVRLTQGRPQDAQASLEFAVQLNPGNADARVVLANVHIFLGSAEHAVHEIERARQLNPFHPSYYMLVLGRAYLELGRAEEAIRVLEQGVMETPDFLIGRRALAAAYAAAGRIPEARSQIPEITKISPGFTLEFARQISPYSKPAHAERFLSLLRGAGIPDGGIVETG